MAEIILAGSVHVDHKGPERLGKVLKHYAPSIVCLEATAKSATKGWNDHLDLAKKIQQTPWHRVYSAEQIERVKMEFLSSYFELWVPKVYKNSSPNIRLFCIDTHYSPDTDALLNQREAVWIQTQLAGGKTLQDLMTPIDVSIKDFVEKGSVEKHQAEVDKRYDGTDVSDFRSRYGEFVFNLVALERDKNFAQKIRELHQENPDKVILATLGSMHIFGDYKGSTYDLLSDLNPTRIKLKDADKL